MALVLAGAWRELQRYKGDRQHRSAFEMRKHDAAAAGELRTADEGAALLLRAPSPPRSLSPRARRLGGGDGGGGSGGGCLRPGHAAAAGSAQAPPTLTLLPHPTHPAAAAAASASQSHSTSMYLSSSPDLLSRRRTTGCSARHLELDGII